MVEQVRTIIGSMGEHNEQCRALAGKDFALITVRRYESCTRYLAELIKLKYNKEDLAIIEVCDELVRDIFIFASFTGLAFIDVQQLAAEHN